MPPVNTTSLRRRIRAHPTPENKQRGDAVVEPYVLIPETVLKQRGMADRRYNSIQASTRRQLPLTIHTKPSIVLVLAIWHNQVAITTKIAQQHNEFNLPL